MSGSHLWSPLDHHGSCLLKAELFLSSGVDHGFKWHLPPWYPAHQLSFTLCQNCCGEQFNPIGIFPEMGNGGLAILGLSHPQRDFWLQASKARISSQPSASIRAWNSLHLIQGLKCLIQASTSSSVKPSPADHLPTKRIAVVWSRITASMTSRLSLIILTLPAGFHFTLGRAQHPLLVVPWTVINKQYLLPESILSWFWSRSLATSSTWSCQESKDP